MGSQLQQSARHRYCNYWRLYGTGVARISLSQTDCNNNIEFLDVTHEAENERFWKIF